MLNPAFAVARVFSTLEADGGFIGDAGKRAGDPATRARLETRSGVSQDGRGVVGDSTIDASSRIGVLALEGVPSFFRLIR